MQRRLLYIFKLLTAPLRENATFIVFVVLLYAANVCLTDYPAKADRVSDFGQFLLGLYLFAAILMAVPQRWRSWLRGIGLGVMYAFCALESFLAMRFDMRIGPSMFMLAMDTTGNESREFISLCLKTHELQVTVATYACIGILHSIVVSRVYNHAPLDRLWKAIGRSVKKNWKLMAQRVATGVLAVVATAYLVGAGMSVPRWIERQDRIGQYLFLTNSRLVERYSESNFYSAPHRLLWAWKFYSLIIQEADVMAKNTEEASVDNCEFRCPKIVLIIGESYSKHHSQLYGYQLATTPKQQAWADEGRLVTFTDAVSPWNLTSNVFKDIMSTHSCNAPGNWTDGVLFPAVFRKAGYSVAFLSNQFYTGKQQANCDVNGSFFLNRSDMDRACFDLRSKKHFTTDGTFLRKELIPYKHRDHELVIVHLYGQHMTYKDRNALNADRSPFSAKDYKRPELSKTDLQTLVDYDNATFYNDTIVSAIYKQFEKEDVVFVYVSDHGEYVYDGKDARFGRTHNTEISPEMARTEFEIPMVMFFTDEFRRLHPEVVTAAEEACRRPFALDDLPHLLMGLAGIHSPHYDPKHDLLHPQYDAKRKRLLRGTTDYDKLMKR